MQSQNLVRDEFKTWGEFVEFATNRRNTSGIEQSRQRESGRWSGTASFEESRDLALNGWFEAEEIAHKLSGQIFDKLSQLIERMEVVNDVTGAGIDMGAFMAGVPDCWQQFVNHTEENVGQKHIRLVFNNTASAGISTSVIIAKGAAVAALVQSLEFAGIRVELWAVPLCTFGKYEARVMVKAADQDLDMGRVMFALGHPSMLRRMGFACAEGHADVMRVIGYGYGRCEESQDKGDVYISSSPLGDPNWADETATINWVKAQLTKQGIVLNEVAA